MPANVGEMAYYGQEPWHGLGTEVDRPMTAAEVVRYAGLGWAVSKKPLQIAGEKETRVPDRFAIVREDRKPGEQGRVLGIVGGQYEPLQNTEAFGFFDSIVERSAAIYHVAGYLGQGEIVWILAKLPNHLEVAEQQIDKYLLLANGHDGTLSVHVRFTPIRVVCRNTLTLALSRRGRHVVVRHTRSMRQRLDHAHELLGITNRHYSAAAEVFRALAARPVTAEEAQRYLEELLPLPGDDRGKSRALRARAACQGLWETGRGNDAKGVEGTWWAAYNGVTEYADHRRQTGGSVRLKNIWFGSGADLKIRAFGLAVRQARIAVPSALEESLLI